MKQAKKFKDLPPLVRGGLIVGGVADVALRIYALIDLVQRPDGQIHGSKKLWAPALGVVSSFGMLPACYLTWGRRRGRVD